MEGERVIGVDQQGNRDGVPRWSFVHGVNSNPVNRIAYKINLIEHNLQQQYGSPFSHSTSSSSNVEVRGSRNVGGRS